MPPNNRRSDAAPESPAPSRKVGGNGEQQEVEVDKESPIPVISVPAAAADALTDVSGEAVSLESVEPGAEAFESLKTKVANSAAAPFFANFHRYRSKWPKSRDWL